MIFNYKRCPSCNKIRKCTYYDRFEYVCFECKIINTLTEMWDDLSRPLSAKEEILKASRKSTIR